MVFVGSESGSFSDQRDASAPKLWPLSIESAALARRLSALLPWSKENSFRAFQGYSDTLLVHRWEEVRLPRPSGNPWTSQHFPNFPRSSLVAAHKTSLQRFARRLPDFPRSSPDLLRSNQTSPDIMGSQHSSPNVKKISETSKRKFGWKLLHHVMPRVLVLKAPRRHVQK